MRRVGCGGGNSPALQHQHEGLGEGLVQGRACNGEADQMFVSKDKSLSYRNTIKAYTNMKNVSLPDSLEKLQYKHRNPNTKHLSACVCSQLMPLAGRGCLPG